ncbi:Kazal domain-containing protein, partial [Lasiosphaeria miniovina]
CGFKIAPCPPGNICRANDPACTRGENCLGTCTRAPPRPTYQPCGGFRVDPARTCGEGYACVDNPFVSGCGMACDWPGICVKVKGAPFCAGFVGKMCPDNMYCIDFPDDGCSVDEGGADCMGLCI